MKRVLGATVCDTTSARLIAESGGMALYKTKSKKFFSVRGDVVRIMTDAEARAWLVRYAGAEVAAAAFAVPDMRKISLDLPVALIDKIDAARDDVRRSRSAVILAALEEKFR
jgi:hypothetical protein